MRKKSSLVWPILNSTDAGLAPGQTTIVLAANTSDEVDWASPRAEGYRVEAGPTGVSVTGVDARGLLYGTGRLLRLLNLSLTQNYYTPRQATATLAAPLAVASSPDRYMRGVQMGEPRACCLLRLCARARTFIAGAGPPRAHPHSNQSSVICCWFRGAPRACRAKGYRPKTNSYDGLTPETFEQYVVDLAMFGVNQIELIPHSFDDAPFSPHFELSHHDMNVQMSATLAKYGMNVSLWYPACNPAGSAFVSCQTGDFNNATVMAAARADWHTVYASMGRIDTVFINAGDPGGQSPDDLVMIAQASRQVLRQYHPDAELWVCPQDWSVPDYEHWAKLVSTPAAAQWLAGTIYGPGMPIGLAEFKNSTFPAQYPVRLYPDITHSLGDQIPVPNWDPVFHFTQNREAVNPRPVQESTIAASNKPFGDAGMGTYNEGCHDDVNKHVWAAVMWGCDDAGARSAACDTPGLVRRWLSDYARVHFGAALQELFVEGIYGLESNWVGPILTNPSINATFAVFQAISKAMPVRLRWVAAPAALLPRQLRQVPAGPGCHRRGR